MQGFVPSLKWWKLFIFPLYLQCQKQDALFVSFQIFMYFHSVTSFESAFDNKDWTLKHFVMSLVTCALKAGEGSTCHKMKVYKSLIYLDQNVKPLSGDSVYIFYANTLSGNVKTQCFSYF